jgi:hypothetical protein
MGGLKGPSIDRVDAIVDEEQKKYVGQLCKAAPDMKSFEASYVKPLFRLIASTLSRDHLRDDQDLQDQVKKEIVKCGSEIYEQVGREVLGPLVVRFAECVLKHAPPGSTVAFLARDAQPYFEAARVLNKREDLASKGLNVRYVTLNRGHLQIADENLEKGGLKPRDSAQEKLIDAYLAQEGFGNPRGVVIVDTGCWGTMIQKLLEEAQVRGPDKLNIQQVFFMYSRNDSIFGFVNEVAKAHGPSKLAKQGVFIADTFEGLPKGEESSKEFAQVSDGPVSPIPRPIDSDYLAEWQEAVLRGVRESTAAYLQSPELFPTAGQALSILEDNRLEAKNSFTGVLPHATPEWSDGKGFLKGWTLSDIPPVNGLVDI